MQIIPAVLAALIALWVLITTAIIIRNAYIPLPLFDAWDDWTLYLHFGKYSSFLFSQHGEHRIALARMFFYLDHSLFRARSAFVIVCNNLIQAVTGLCLWRLFNLSGVKNRNTLALFVSFIACCLFSAQQFTNLTWAYQIQFVAVYCTAVGSILSLVRAIGRERQTFYFSLAIVLAVLSTFSMSNGLFLWPVLVALAFWLEFPLRFRFGLGIGTVIMATIYLWGYTQPSKSASPIDSVVHRLPAVVVFSVAYLGSPFDPLATLNRAGGGGPDASVTRAAICGAAGALIVVILAVVLWRKRRTSQPAQIALLHVLFFILITAALVGMGRVNFPAVEAMTSRYVTPAMVFWVSLISLVWSLASTWLDARPWWRRIATGALILAMFCGVAIHQEKWIEYSRNYAATVGDAQSAIVAGVFDEQAWRVAFHTPNAIFGVIHYLRRNRLSVFSEDWTQWTGMPVKNLFTIDRPNTCVGHFDEAVIVSPKFMPGSRVEGWAWDSKDQRGPDTIVLADRNNNVAGVVRNILARPDVAADAAFLNTDRVGWRGYIAGVSPRRITAYILERDGKSLCAIGSLNVGSRVLAR